MPPSLYRLLQGAGGLKCMVQNELLNAERKKMMQTQDIVIEMRSRFPKPGWNLRGVLPSPGGGGGKDEYFPLSAA
ncbi:MAG: hypothetical protein C0614_11805 [Desulfuromonas sp.]|nr:MAG: hypothetical protein C0614_11805 [Desulfuromonas sp.]